jgi:hypothetical protein
MTNKTISINPSLFAMGGAKTKKSRDKKQKSTVAPLISPNVLKNKLLKRIKEHKQRETENLEPKGGADNTHNLEFNIKSPGQDEHDEFMASVGYLKTLSDENKKRADRAISENKRQQQKRDLERNTVKHYQSLNGAESQQHVNIELPEELSMPLIQINTDVLSSNGGTSPYKNDTVPFGVLKGGLKQTYRDWNKTQRSNIVTDSNLALTIQGGGLQTKQSARENRLAELRAKLKQKQVAVSNNTDRVPDKALVITMPTPTPTPTIQPARLINQPVQFAATTHAGSPPNGHTIATKRTTKKTTKRKYTLGRSKIRNSVAVLIKDRGTRKQVLNAQKDLKRKSINDVKMYLREHNLIKVGSNAPNDVMRKMYESAMLAGEIKNSNAETLLHNFSKDDKEL